MSELVTIPAPRTAVSVSGTVVIPAVIADAGEPNDWLAHKVLPMFEERALPVSEEVMFKWRLLVEDGRKAGHTYSQPDLIIAATALHHDLTVVTRDAADFTRARVPVLNPWRHPAG